MRIFEEIHRRPMDALGCRIVTRRVIELPDMRVRAEHITTSGGPCLDARPRAASWDPGHAARLPGRFAQ